MIWFMDIETEYQLWCTFHLVSNCQQTINAIYRRQQTSRRQHTDTRYEQNGEKESEPEVANLYFFTMNKSEFG